MPNEAAPDASPAHSTPPQDHALAALAGAALIVYALLSILQALERLLDLPDFAIFVFRAGLNFLIAFACLGLSAAGAQKRLTSLIASGRQILLTGIVLTSISALVQGAAAYEASARSTDSGSTGSHFHISPTYTPAQPAPSTKHEKKKLKKEKAASTTPAPQISPAGS